VDKQIRKTKMASEEKQTEKKPDRSSQARRVLITINNFTQHGLSREDVIEILKKMKPDRVSLCVEIGEQGTEHLHAYFERQTPIAFKTIKNKIPEAHVDYARGTALECEEYIKKIGKWEGTEKAKTTVEGSFWEMGENISTASKNKRLLELIKDGYTKKQILEDDPYYITRMRQIDELLEMYAYEKFQTSTRAIEVFYVFGKTGLGKTHYVYANHDYNEVCTITTYRDGGSKIYFDEYKGEDVLVFDEFQGEIPLNSLLRWLDKYPVSLPARYHDRTACFTKVYMLSNLSLDQIYNYEKTMKPDVWDSFVRRISHIYHFYDFGLFEELNKEDFLCSPLKLMTNHFLGY